MAGNLARDLERWVAPWKRRIQLMIARCVISSVNVSGAVPVVTVKTLDGEEMTVYQYQLSGFSSRPSANDHGVVAFPGGDRRTGMLVASETITRPDLENDGDSAMHNTSGCVIRLNGTSIEIDCATGGTVSINGNLVVEV